MPPWARALVEEFWPGPLTLVCRQQASLMWDLGETRRHRRGADARRRASRWPSSSAPARWPSAPPTLTGRPAATDADAGRRRCSATSVAVIVDGGTSPGGEASTIIDVTVPQGRVLRLGALSLDALNAVVEEHGVVLADEG